MDPEYIRNGKYSVKSDVYSFGILILEIVSRKRRLSLLPDGDMMNLPTLVSTVFYPLLKVYLVLPL
jgi:serine/threonine protein kinase